MPTLPSSWALRAMLSGEFGLPQASWAAEIRARLPVEVIADARDPGLEVRDLEEVLAGRQPRRPDDVEHVQRDVERGSVGRRHVEHVAQRDRADRPGDGEDAPQCTDRHGVRRPGLVREHLDHGPQDVGVGHGAGQQLRRAADRRRRREIGQRDVGVGQRPIADQAEVDPEQVVERSEDGAVAGLDRGDERAESIAGGVRRDGVRRPGDVPRSVRRRRSRCRRSRSPSPPTAGRSRCSTRHRRRSPSRPRRRGRPRRRPGCGRRSGSRRSTGCRCRPPAPGPPGVRPPRISRARSSATTSTSACRSAPVTRCMPRSTTNAVMPMQHRAAISATKTATAPRSSFSRTSDGPPKTVHPSLPQAARACDRM